MTALTDIAQGPWAPALWALLTAVLGMPAIFLTDWLQRRRTERGTQPERGVDVDVDVRGNGTTTLTNATQHIDRRRTTQNIHVHGHSTQGDDDFWVMLGVTVVAGFAAIWAAVTIGAGLIAAASGIVVGLALVTTLRGVMLRDGRLAVPGVINLAMIGVSAVFVVTRLNGLEYRGATIESTRDAIGREFPGVAPAVERILGLDDAHSALAVTVVLAVVCALLACLISAIASFALLRGSLASHRNQKQRGTVGGLLMLTACATAAMVLSSGSITGQVDKHFFKEPPSAVGQAHS